MERRVDITTTGGGFFHPFARSVPPRPAAAAQPAAAKVDGVRPPPARSERPRIPTSGGFVNPQARPARQ